MVNQHSTRFHIRVRRWWAKVEQTDGCWIWHGFVHAKKGYGHHGVDSAHRFGYELLVGPIPAGLVLDHLCHNADPECPGGACIHRRCVRPDHLEPVSNRENILRGKGETARRARQTHCVRGHELAGHNVRINEQGRQCRRCSVERSLEYKRAKATDRRAAA
jgi:hypothetical protein